MNALERQAVIVAKRHFMRDEGEGVGWDFETGMQLLAALASKVSGRAKTLRELIEKSPKTD